MRRHYRVRAAGVESKRARVSGALGFVDGTKEGCCELVDNSAELWAAESEDASVIFVAISCRVLNISASLVNRRS